MSHTITKSLAALAMGFAVLAPAAAFAHEDEAKGLGAGGVAIAVQSDGKATVRNATVTAIASSSLTATTVFGGATLTWTVNTDSSTKFLGKGEGTITLAGITVGDKISFTGTLNSGSSLSVLASTIKDLSKAPNGTTLVGTISAVNASTTALTVLKAGGGSASLALNASTTILVNGIVSPFSSLAVGNVVKALGSWNTDQSVFTATTLAVGQALPREGKEFKNFFKKFFSGRDRHGGGKSDD